jgi:hypothetical protein
MLECYTARVKWIRFPCMVSAFFSYVMVVVAPHARVSPIVGAYFSFLFLVRFIPFRCFFFSLVKFLRAENLVPLRSEFSGHHDWRCSTGDGGLRITLLLRAQTERELYIL